MVKEAFSGQSLSQETLYRDADSQDFSITIISSANETYKSKKHQNYSIIWNSLKHKRILWQMIFFSMWLVENEAAAVQYKDQWVQRLVVHSVQNRL